MSELTAVVTGSASGMGYAVAARFLAEGWTVLGVDLAAGPSPDSSTASSTGSSAGSSTGTSAGSSAGGRFIPVTADVTDRSGVARALREAAGDREVRTVVNAAGIYPTSTLADYTEALYRRIFDVNVLGTLNVTAAAVDLIRAHGNGGAVVNFASIDAFAVSPGQLVYSASKAAVVSLTRTLAVELAGDAIAVNAVAPGWVETPGTLAGGRLAEAVKAVPLGRAAKPAEIAEWVWRLGSAPGSYLTGETLVVSGGLVMR
jgi:3-oxoacyl-[acyl-carrier protein] reductase